MGCLFSLFLLLLLSAARYLRYHTCLLSLPNWPVKRCTTLNPASLLPLPEDGVPHDCLAELDLTCTSRPDLSDTLLTNPDLVFYVDGSASCDPDIGASLVGFAVVTDSDVVCDDLVLFLIISVHRPQNGLLSLKPAEQQLVKVSPFS